MKKNYPVTGQEVSYDASLNILSTTDPKGRITHVNEDFVRISGFTREELIGKAHNIVRHPDMPPEAFQDLWDTIKGGDSWMGIVKNRCKNGDHYWVSAYVTPVMRDGRIVEFQSVRRKPEPEEIARAERLYASLRSGRKPFWMRFPTLPFRVRLMMAFIAVMAFTLAVPAWTGHLDWRTAGMSLILPALFVLGYYLWDVRPLCRMFARARSIFDNPIARYVYTGRNDEVGQVMLALRHLEAEAAALVGRMDDSAEDLRHSADRLRSAIVSSKQNIDRQHAETDMVATAVTEMSASIQEVASNAERSAEAAGTAHERTIESKEVVNKTMQAIQELASDVQNASEVIARLSENSERISSIVNVITGIAEQTNLLALNAAIEAARAGEQGRGFAVVADEVRTLANRTHDSTSEIQEMIEQLQEGAKQAVQVMEQSLAKTDSSVERGREAVGSLDAVTEAIARITDMSVQIAAAVAEQKEVAQEVARSVTNIQDLSRISVEAMEESETAGLQVAKESDELKALTGQFWERRR